MNVTELRRLIAAAEKTKAEITNPVAMAVFNATVGPMLDQWKADLRKMNGDEEEPVTGIKVEDKDFIGALDFNFGRKFEVRKSNDENSDVKLTFDTDEKCSNWFFQAEDAEYLGHLLLRGAKAARAEASKATS